MTTLKVAVLVAAISLSQNSFAGQSANTKYCDAIESMARSIMEFRQDGFSLKAAMGVLGDNKTSREMLLNAYKKLLWPTEVGKQRAINQFANKNYLKCLK